MKILNIKTGVLLAASALALLSCGKESQISTPQGADEPIVFSAPADHPVSSDDEATATKSSGLVTGTTLPGSSFVYTYRLPSPDGGTTPGTPANAIGLYIPKYTVPAAGVTTIYTWPSGINDYLMFFGYYPTSGVGLSPQNEPVAGNVYNNPTMQLSYTMDQDPAKQFDLLYASTGPLYRKPVPLVYNHALTRISIKAVLAKDVASVGDGAVVKVASIKIQNVRNKGTLMVYSNNTIPEWILSTVPTDNRTIDMSIAQPNPLASTIDGYDITWDGNGQLVNVALDPDGKTPYDLLNNNSGKAGASGGSGDLLLIPQDNSMLMMDITVIGTKYVSNVKKTINEHNFMVFTGDDGAAPKWSMGRYIQYTLYIARDVIYLGAMMFPWNTVTATGAPYKAVDSATDGDLLLKPNPAP